VNPANSPNTFRKIIHVDMDAFYASVEQRENPELRGKPIAVGGSSKRGVVAAASYEARRFGVRSAMPSAMAKKLCPDLIFVRHQFDLYREISHQIHAIFYEYTDLVEPLSLDEAYLDVTENKINLNSGTLIAEQIRQKIFEQTQLTASAGVSYCKFLAKMASDINKPNGLKVILPAEAEAFLEELPVEKFHGIGKATAARMRKFGIRKGSDLKERSLLYLVRTFGKVGNFYYNIVRGIDNRAVQPHRERKSISVERTFFDDIYAYDRLDAELEKMTEILLRRIESAGKTGRTFTLKVKYADFTIVSRSKTINQPVETRQQMLDLALPLLRETEAHSRKVRLLGMGVSNLIGEEEEDEGIPWFGRQLFFDYPDGEFEESSD